MSKSVSGSKMFAIVSLFAFAVLILTYYAMVRDKYSSNKGDFYALMREFHGMADEHAAEIQGLSDMPRKEKLKAYILLSKAHRKEIELLKGKFEALDSHGKVQAATEIIVALMDREIQLNSLQIENLEKFEATGHRRYAEELTLITDEIDEMRKMADAELQEIGIFKERAAASPN